MTTYRKLCNWAFQRTIIGSLKSKMAEIHHLQKSKSTWRYFFCWGWSDLAKISETGAEWHVNWWVVLWSKLTPDVKFQHGGRLGKFSGMSSQSKLPHCMVLPTGEFNVMIPELSVTLEGAATGWIQWYVIPEPRITLQGAATWWIHRHDSRAKCHTAGCSHLAKSMSWSCHIAGCKNYIHYTANRLSSYLFFVFNAV